MNRLPDYQQADIEQQAGHSELTYSLGNNEKHVVRDYR